MFSFDVNEDFVNNILPAIVMTILPLFLGYFVATLFVSSFWPLFIIGMLLMFVLLYFVQKINISDIITAEYITAFFKKDYAETSKIKDKFISTSYAKVFLFYFLATMNISLIYLNPELKIDGADAILGNPIVQGAYIMVVFAYTYHRFESINNPIPTTTCKIKLRTGREITGLALPRQKSFVRALTLDEKSMTVSLTAVPLDAVESVSLELLSIPDSLKQMLEKLKTSDKNVKS